MTFFILADKAINEPVISADKTWKCLTSFAEWNIFSLLKKVKRT
jgi:hypothetical protein